MFPPTTQRARVPEARLYVDAAAAPALALYRKLGFRADGPVVRGASALAPATGDAASRRPLIPPQHGAARDRLPAIAASILDGVRA